MVVPHCSTEISLTMTIVAVEMMTVVAIVETMIEEEEEEDHNKTTDGMISAIVTTDVGVVMIDVVGMMIDVVATIAVMTIAIAEEAVDTTTTETIVTLDMVMDAKAEVKVDKMNWDITDHYEKINELKPNYLVT